MIKAVLVVLTMIATPAVADSRMEVCKIVSEGASGIMKIRQDGVPLISILTALKHNKMFVQLVLIAYDTPKYSTEENQQGAITEFGNTVLLQCLKGSGKYASN
tara:strand:- start:1673 stop:1981 length:309 start_codon:yes stop_codon:yes gene_type:complete